MKIESYLLRTLFLACMVLCFGTLGSMLFARQPGPARTILESRLQAAPVQADAAPLACPQAVEDAPCTRLD